MKHFKESDFSDRSGRIWFNADKFENIPASLEVTAEEFTFDGTTVSNERSGDIVGNLGTFDATFGAKFAKVAFDFEAPDAVFEGTFTPSFNAIDVSFAEPSIDMGSGRGMSCDFELPELTINEVVNMADMELIFKEPDLFLSGDNTFVYLQMKTEKADCEMHSGSPLSLELEEFSGAMTGSIGLMGEMALKFRNMDLDAVGGRPAYIDLELEPLSIEAAGDTIIHAELTASIKKALCEFTGLSPNSTTLNVRFGLLSADLDGDNHPVGSINAGMLPMRAIMSSQEHITADLDGVITVLRMKASLLVDGPNSIDLVFPRPEIFINDNGGDCSLADTLSFGG